MIRSIGNFGRSGKQKKREQPNLFLLQPSGGAANKQTGQRADRFE
jgi:hypothetical protein